MAGLTTASLVALEEPQDDPVYAIDQSRLSRWLGLDSSISTINAIGLLTSGLSTITSLVFLNASQPFLLDYLDVKHGRGSVTGRLLFADEMTSLVVYFIAGVTADRLGIRLVAVTGHVIVAVALLLYVSVKSTYPGLLLSRMFFACGAGALVVVLGAGLASMTASHQRHVDPGSEASERSPLLRSEPSDERESRPQNSARFAGLLGLSTGLGALLAVFVFLPLPANLVHWVPKMSLRTGLKYTFALVALLALLEAIFLLFALRMVNHEVKTEPKSSNKAAVISALKDLPLGFRLARRNWSTSLSFISSFSSRSSATIVTGFIPLLVNHYFRTHSLCDNLVADPSGGPEACRSAFVWASILSGAIQTVSLCACPLIGMLGSYTSQPLVLLGTSLLGAGSFLGMAALPDPRHMLVWPCVVGIGLAQAGGIVISLSLLATGRAQLVATQKREIGGALSAAYSFSGGIGILSVGQISGTLFDRWVGAPFAIIGGVYGVVAFCSALSLWQRRAP